jgi:outer membrane murein-binding lipoprotein Lpp
MIAGDKMNKKAIVLIFVVLLSALFVSGCAETTIKNTEQASEAVNNISSDVTGVTGALEDIDEILGGE